MTGDDKRQVLGALGNAAFMGLDMAACIAAGLLLGRFIDNNITGSYPWATVGGIVLGMLAGLWSVYRMIMKNDREK